MPWQAALANVAGEVLETDDGPRMAHRVIVARVPRRAGKSTLTLATMVQRMLAHRGMRCGYTAQTRTDAAGVLRDEWRPRLADSVLSPLLSVRLSNGAERVNVPRLNSSMRILSPNENAGHGSPLDLAVLDEAWSFTNELGMILENGLRPAMIDRPRWRQLWVISAAGTHESTWLDKWLGLLESGHVAGVDYSADPDTDDLDDPATWARVHPAVGHRITVADLVDERPTMDADEFNRAYLGVTTQAADRPRVIPAPDWYACAWPDAPEPAGSLTLGFDTDLDGTASAIAAAWTVDGRLYADVIACEPGSGWLVPTVRDLRQRRRPRGVWHDTAGPVLEPAAALVRAGVGLRTLDTRAAVEACQSLMSQIRERTVRIVPSPWLEEAVRSVARRPVGDGWVWSRRGSSGPVAPLLALTWAVHGERTAARTKPSLGT